MRYGIYGAGAIGGTLAARLARARKRVVVIARGDPLDAIKAGGLRLESPDESIVVSVDAVWHPGELDWEPDVVVLLCTKTQDSEAERRYAAAGIDYASAAEFAERRGDLIEPVPVGDRTQEGSPSWQSLDRRCDRAGAGGE